MKKGLILFFIAFAVVSSLMAQVANRPSGLSSLRDRLANRRPNQTQPQAPSTGATTMEDVKNAPRGTNGVPAFVFDQAPLEIVLAAYAEQANKTIIPAPDLPKATITLKSLEGQEFTKEEYLTAIEAKLVMEGVVLEPFGEKFLRAFPRKTIRTSGIKTKMIVDKNGLKETGKIVSQLIRFQHIPVDEAQKAIEGFKDPNGLFQVFERNNSILVTDTEENVNRMLEIVKELDVATPVLEEVFVREVKFALAADIKTALETIVTESQKDDQKPSGPKQSGAPGFGSAPQPTMLRNRLLGRPQVETPQVVANKTMTAMVSDADRGMIRGKVLILADERSNKLIIITMKTNMDFFDRVIETLDVETTPDVKVEVIRMKYADAEEVSSMLNDLIGNGSSSSTQKNNQNANAGRTGATARNLTRTTTTQPQRRPGGANPTFSQNSRLGELNKDNIKILADKRINAVVVMARTADMKAVQEVIDDMDVKLSQVLIETVIVQVELGDDLQTGIDWVQRGRERVSSRVQATDSFGRKLYWIEDDETGRMRQTTEETDVPVMKTIRNVVRDGFYNNGNYMLGGGGGSGTAALGNLMGTAVSGGSSSSNTGNSDDDEDNPVSKAAEAGSIVANPIGGGLNYFLKSDKLNISAVIQASKSDSRTKVLASPILMTVDNKEATIEATDMIYLFSGYQYSGSTYNGSQVRNYEKRDIGLTVKVTPRINPNGTVVLTVEQTFETQGADQNVPNENGGTDPYATVTTRKISSDVSVENKQTVVMGGLTKKTNTESESGIPILKDIPYIGKWLFGSVSQKEARSELLVFMTPYVLDDGEAAQLEALRRKKSLSDSRPWEDNGWSSSPLADPVSKKEQLRRLNDEWKRQDQERKTKLEIEKAKMERAKKLKKMSASEREYWMELHKKELEEEQKENKEEQEELRKIVEGIKAEKLSEAEKEIEKSKEVEKNEHQKELEKAAKTKEVKKEDSPKAGAAQ